MKDVIRSHPGKIVALVSLAFVLAFIGFSITSLVGQQFAWAAQAHIAHSSSATLHHSSLVPLANPGAVPEPTVINGQWYCRPPYIPQSRQINKNGGAGAVNFSVICIKKDLTFPCSDRQGPNENIISRDWLSGDVPSVKGPGAAHHAGHVSYTYPEDTYAFPEIATLFGYMQGIAFVMITPSAVLLAYNIMLGASTFRYVGTLEGLSRLVLGGVAVSVSFTLVQMLINLETVMAIGIIRLHAEFPFPQASINGMAIPYTLPAESSKRFSESYRGLVVPMSRWGCAANDFVGVFAPQFITDTLASAVPLIGDLAHLAGTVTTLSDLIRRTGAMTLTVLSILLWVQVFVRIMVINYYTLTAPLSFSCWGMPGGVGQKVVTLWFKGFFSVLFVQVFQLFILTTLPLILPALPQIPADSVGLMQGFLVEFPPILTLCVALMAPTLIGASAGKIIGTAGSMAGQTIIVLGTAASQAS